MGTHSKSTVEKWSTIVTEFIESNSSPKEYNKKTGVNVNTLYTWRQRFGLTGKTPTVQLKNTSFKELKFSEDSNPSPVNTATAFIEIIFSDKIKISVSGNYDEEVLSKTVKVLSNAVC